MNFKKVIATGLLVFSTSIFQMAWAADDLAVETGDAPDSRITRNVNIPGADYFAPFVINIRAGDVVRFTNNDEDDHSVTSSDLYTSPGFRGVNAMIPKEDSNGRPGVVRIRFLRPGTFTYFCRFHAHPVQGQPVNGGTDGQGIPGRPMMGIIIVR